MKQAMVILATVVLVSSSVWGVDCPMCGAKNLEGAKVCEECKSELPKPATPPKPPVKKPDPVKPVKPTVPVTPRVKPADGGEESGENLPLITAGSGPLAAGVGFDPKNNPEQRDAVTFGEIDDKAVAQAIKAGAERLWGQQLANGSWPPFGVPTDGKGKPNHNYHLTGPTAMAVYALLESGASLKDPRMAKAIDWLANERGEIRTYSLGLRCNAWAAAIKRAGADQEIRGRLVKCLRDDSLKLWGNSNAGGYTYLASPARDIAAWDNSNSQYGLLGVWAAAQAGLEVPDDYWRKVWGHWAKTQLPDGGWGYNYAKWGQGSRGTMTVAGLASLLVCYEQLGTSRFLDCGARMNESARIEAGLKWLIANFGNPDMAGGGQGLGGGGLWNNMLYYMYGVERVGLATGMKYFGTVDWYKDGVSRLVAGGMLGGGTVHDTCFAMLFLVRGRHPVIINRLQYKGDWNNRPGALANLTRWVGDNFEHTLSWQNINIEAPVAAWHDAPIVHISGTRKPTFTEEEIGKMRDYVLQGGMIFSMAECGGKAFDTGMREAYQKMFPQYELARCGQGHELFTKAVGYSLPPETPVFVLSNGMRPLAIHTEQDWARAWQSRRHVAFKTAFEFGANIIHYVMMDTKTMARPRGLSPWPAGAWTNGTGIKLARLKHSGNFDPEPMAIRRFAQLASMRDGLNLDVVGPIAIAELPASGALIATLVGTGSFRLTETEETALREFIKKGGTLLLEAAGGAEAFQKPARDLVTRLFPDAHPELLPPNHPVYRLGVPIASVSYRSRTVRRVGYPSGPPRLLGVRVNQKTRIFISHEDITGGLLGSTFATLDGYRAQSAHTLMLNLIHYAQIRGREAAPAK